MNSLLIGIGHSYRGDDAVGPMLAEALSGTAGLDVLVHHGEGTDLMERWTGYNKVVVVDATCSGAEPGTVRIWDAIAETLPTGLFPKGSHVFGLAEGVEMARILGRLPPVLTVVGIEGRSFSTGDAMSAEVSGAAPRTALLILKYISS